MWLDLGGAALEGASAVTRPRLIDFDGFLVGDDGPH